MKTPRQQKVEALRDRKQQWDAIIIGGGASGIASALDLASRGIKTLLLESQNFASETSSRSTKLIHGGVRYLEQGHFGLVKEALFERQLLLKNAAKIVTPLEFFIPAQNLFQSSYYCAGLIAYDLFSRDRTLPKSRSQSKRKTIESHPNIKPPYQQGGVTYWDAQFDDCELALAMINAFESLGGTALNYCPVIDLIHSNKKMEEVVTQPQGDATIQLKAKIIINATDPFSDTLRQQDLKETPSRETKPKSKQRQTF